MSSTKSLARAIDSNWTVSPLSKEVAPIAEGCDGMGGMSCSATASRRLLVEFLSLPRLVSMARKVVTPDGAIVNSEVSNSRSRLWVPATPRSSMDSPPM